MNITADENIPFAREAFGLFGNLKLMPGREIDNASLKDCDVLIVRSITEVNEELLNGTPVKFVGTATIGTDHIDKKYLDDNNIRFADAAGCNSDSVAEYVFCAIIRTAYEKKLDLNELTLGVIGEGNIGSRVARLGKALGMRVLKNDPPKERVSPGGYVNLDAVLKESDIITFHVPLNNEGRDKTHHLLNSQNLPLCKEGAVIINSSRGAVIDNNALLEVIDEKNFTVILDVWEDEPELNIALLDKVYSGTPHIAGYSFEGKVNGTVFIYNALCDFLDTPPKWTPEMPPVENDLIEVNTDKSIETMLNKLFMQIYDISKDDKKLRNILTLDRHDHGKYFDFLRKNYWIRREFFNYTLELNPYKENIAGILMDFRFNIFEG